MVVRVIFSPLFIGQGWTAVLAWLRNSSVVLSEQISHALYESFLIAL